MNKIEHIGIAVKSLKNSNLLFEKLFGESHYKTESVESEGVKTSFFKVGENKIELLKPQIKTALSQSLLKKRVKAFIT